jgi:ElaB/YqjD/DUF883 family membrane-anchored ribosome-binding protein
MNHEASVTESTTPRPGSGGANVNGNAPDNAQSGIVREYHNLLSDLQDLVASTRASVGSLGGELAERARSGAVVADDYVRAQPWQAVGISAGLGLVIGFVLGRGRRGA